MKAEQSEQDRRLVERLRAGDEAAFAGLVRSWTPDMVRLARGYVPSREVAEEVVQDTWLAILTGIDRFEGRSSLRTWVFHIVVRRAQQTGLRERRSLPFSTLWNDERAPAVEALRFHPANAAADARGWISPPRRWEEPPDQRWRSGELRDVIDSAISALPRLQRQVVTARDVWECDPAQVCRLLSITTNHQRVLLFRARARLRSAVTLHRAAERSRGALAPTPRSTPE
ncbi:RNA polymerase sigma factor [Lapillicoccus sp.]|uniref:RNA polymerase sigma factor n=1 Tax=Lapillicoccus sp. TaxID=1909287 RepID=UPI00398367CF